MFLRMHTVKSDQRCSLSEDRLDQLIQIAVDGVPYKNGMLLGQYSCGGKTSSEDLHQDCEALIETHLNLEKKSILRLIWRIETDSFVITLCDCHLILDLLRLSEIEHGSSQF